MVGQAHWFTGIVLMLGAILTVGLPLLLSRIGSKFRGVRRDLTCPKTKHVARVELAQCIPTLRFTGVYRCSEFGEPNRVRCARACVLEANGRG